MPRNGSGVYSKPSNTTAISGTTIESSMFNTLMDDIVTDLNTDRPVAAGGTGASTAADARANLGIKLIPHAIDTTGSSNTYAVTTGDSLSSLTDGYMLIIIANHSNSGAATLNADTLGATAVKKFVAGTATALASGDLVAGTHYILTYDSGETAWILHNPSLLPNGGTAVTITDAGSYYTGTTVEAALQELGAGQHTIWVPAGAFTPNTTNGAATGSIETTTNAVMVTTLDFDASTDESAQIGIQMPKSWDEGTLIFQFVWTHPSTTTNFDVIWGVQAVALANDDALDTAFGTAQTVTDTGGTTNDVYITAETSALTVAGSPGAEELVMFKVYRDANAGGDTLAVDAKLIGLKIHYTLAGINDS